MVRLTIESTAWMAREVLRSGKRDGNLQKKTLRKQRDSAEGIGRKHFAQLFYFFMCFRMVSALRLEAISCFAIL